MPPAARRVQGQTAADSVPVQDRPGRSALRRVPQSSASLAADLHRDHDDDREEERGPRGSVHGGDDGEGADQGQGAGRGEGSW